MKFRKTNSRGVALVLTLIMLAIITVVTVVFLATARRNRQVTTLTHDRTDAEFAGDTAYQRANAEIIERILRDTNMSSFGFLVSQPAGNIESVLYTNGLPPNGLPGHSLIPTVANASRTLGIYLDLNRNGFFDPGTTVIVTNIIGGKPVTQTNIPSGYRLGDPIWIGILDKPWLQHAPNNRFIARMAYAVLPAGEMLDLNNIHNTNYIPGSTASTGYLRNQGFGPWEMNLAAFFAELAPNVWWNDGTPQYTYGPFPKPIAGGLAFEDAFSFVNYRRGFGQQVKSLLMEFPSALAAPSFPPTSIDAYSDGNAGVLLGTDPFLADDVTPPSRAPWSGADSANHFFDIQEVFDQKIFNPLNQPFAHFPERISNVISNDGSAYYRIISQLGTDTGSDFRDRINLNYADEHAGYSVTNFQSWDDPTKPDLAVAFFTNVAQRIFLAQSNEFNPTTNQAVIRSITEIPISPVNMYSPAIHRVLQEAANIFDATRTNIYPSVFRPVFGTKPGSNPTNYIIGYVNDPRVSTLQAWLDTNTNGIPMIVGAKKGFPNFNEFTARSDLLMERKVQLTRPDPGSRPNGTNQMYLLGISNYFGAESWNSYMKSPPYQRDLQIVVSNYATATLTNSLGFQGKAVLAVATNNFIPAASWRGGAFGQIDPTSFKMTLNTSTSSWSNAVYRFNGNYFTNIGLNAFEQTTGFPLPYWVCTLSNRVVYYMTEPGSDRIIDFVLLQDYGVIDLFRDLVGANPYNQIAGGVDATIKGVWDTNTASANAPTRGILRQLDISLGTFNTSAADWRQFALTATRNDNDKNNAINAFRSFCGLSPLPGTGGAGATNVSLEMQAPFNPAAKLAVLSTWQANDPLVHYHVDDLRMPGSATNHQYLKPGQPGSNAAPSSIGFLNSRYSPWGGNPNSSYEEGAYDRATRDAGVTSSDEWNFPTNKMASIGLLGRIHRGTPWQTIYFKSERAPLFAWTNSSPDLATRFDGRIFSRTHPTNDWRLADMFTTALDERTSSGLLSVNQQGLESWSALLSGVVVLSNSLKTPILNLPRQYTEAFIEPWGARPLGQSPLGIIWSNIHAFQVRSPQPLQSVGDILQVPQLTVESPFLNQTGDQIKWGLDDYAYEQIPQQILSLLRVGPARFVIYAYGQALKPAEIDPATGNVSNYQVTAEYATRTVIRVEGDARGRVRTVVESFNILPPD